MRIAGIYRLPKIALQSLSNAIEHDGIEHAGYLSFLLIVCIFPFLVFFTVIAGYISKIIGIPIVETLIEVVLDSSWASFIDALKPRIIEIATVPPQEFLTIAVVSTIWSGSSIFEAVRTTLNRAYQVTQPPIYVVRRLMSIIEFFAIIIIVAIVLILLIVLPAFWSVIGEYTSLKNHNMLVMLGRESSTLRSLMIYIFALIFVSSLYCLLPSIKQKFRTVLPGTIIVLLLWSCFSRIFYYYIASFSQINMIYGSIAGIVIALVYFYICSFIFILGAEFNQLLNLNRLQ